MSATLEKYVFTPEANVDPTRPENEHPRMLNRLISGLLHPLIHVGYGLEFGLPGMLVEGKLL